MPFLASTEGAPARHAAAAPPGAPRAARATPTSVRRARPAGRRATGPGIRLATVVTTVLALGLVAAFGGAPAVAAPVQAAPGPLSAAPGDIDRKGKAAPTTPCAAEEAGSAARPMFAGQAGGPVRC
ncbi:hypothetical protein [Plantactinospora sp. CA-290183]|uniref:hypothetical protein n=1 Tax=Plantactinospora sp. CA-290183 TaxID=3240006 RepID=UPI003D8B2BA0